MLPYIEEQLSHGVRLHHMTRHLLNLFNNQPRARYSRRSLTQAAQLLGSEGMLMLKRVLDEMKDVVPA